MCKQKCSTVRMYFLVTSYNVGTSDIPNNVFIDLKIQVSSKHVSVV